MQTDADTIRQALCEKGDEKYVLATFATTAAARSGSNTAKDYGGYYLVEPQVGAVGRGGDRHGPARHARRDHGGGVEAHEPRRQSQPGRVTTVTRGTRTDEGDGGGIPRRRPLPVTGLPDYWQSWPLLMHSTICVISSRRRVDEVVVRR
ncbi:hypothetical protein GCM10023238_26230 [Streptomyces heliomycini]